MSSSDPKSQGIGAIPVCRWSQVLGDWCHSSDGHLNPLVCCTLPQASTRCTGQPAPEQETYEAGKPPTETHKGKVPCTLAPYCPSCFRNYYFQSCMERWRATFKKYPNPNRKNISIFHSPRHRRLPFPNLYPVFVKKYNVADTEVFIHMFASPFVSFPTRITPALTGAAFIFLYLSFFF